MGINRENTLISNDYEQKRFSRLMLGVLIM